MASWLQAVSDWLLAGVGGLVTLVGGYAKKVDSTASEALDTAERVERRQIGDPDDPNAEGVLDIAYETREKVDQLETRMDREHREVMSKLEEISDGDYEAAGGD